MIKEAVLQPINGSRIDPKFVNNPELSDVTFRVEGKIFYGHKIVLVTASPRLQSLLSSKVSEGNGTPTVQINDIRYHIFEVKTEWLFLEIDFDPIIPSISARHAILVLRWLQQLGRGAWRRVGADGRRQFLPVGRSAALHGSPVRGHH